MYIQTSSTLVGYNSNVIKKTIEHNNLTLSENIRGFIQGMHQDIYTVNISTISYINFTFDTYISEFKKYFNNTSKKKVKL